MELERRVTSVCLLSQLGASFRGQGREGGLPKVRICGSNLFSSAREMG